MKWYYESNGNPHGPVEEAELRQLKDDGKLLGESLVWRQGMKDWTPLNAVSDFEAVHSAQTAADEKATQSNSKIIPELGPSNIAHSTEAQHASEPINSTSDKSDSASSRDPVHTPIRVRPEWEHSSEVGPLGAFLLSLRDILIDAKDTFRRLNRNGGWGLPLLFLLITEFLGNIFMVLSIKQVPLSASPAVALLRQALQMENGETVLLYSSLASLFMLPLAILIKAVVIHASLKFFGRSCEPFSTTFRTLCYALGAGSMLWSVPLIAVSIAATAGDSTATAAALFLASTSIGLWSAWINVRALASAHELSILRTLLSVVGPPLLAALLFALFFGTVATLAQA
jgi:hypothetical protein